MHALAGYLDGFIKYGILVTMPICCLLVIKYQYDSCLEQRLETKICLMLLPYHLLPSTVKHRAVFRRIRSVMFSEHEG